MDPSAVSGVAFRIRGTGPGFQAFISWDALPPGEAGAVLGLAITAGPAPGAFRFQIDEVTLR